jgi:hypothetical protein
MKHPLSRPGSGAVASPPERAGRDKKGQQEAGNGHEQKCMLGIFRSHGYLSFVIIFPGYLRGKLFSVRAPLYPGQPAKSSIIAFIEE